MRLWLKADAITGLVDGDPVGAWNDSSGNAFNTSQATGAKKPLYKTNIVGSLPVVRFDGSDDVLTGSNWTTVINTFGGGVYTFLALIRVSAAAAGAAATYDDAAMAMDSGGFTGVAQTRTTSGTLRIRGFNWDGSEDFVELTESFNTWYRVTQDHTDVSNLRIKADGGTFQSTASGGPSASGAMLIGSNYAGAKFFQGDIAEVVAYNSVLSDTDRDSIEQYLLDKWFPTAPPVTARPGTFDPELVPAGWF